MSERDAQVGWSSDYLQLPESVTAADALELLEDSTAQWVVIGQTSSGKLAACLTDEALALLSSLDEDALRQQSLEQALKLEPSDFATIVPHRFEVPDVPVRPAARFESAIDFMVVDDSGRLTLGGETVRRLMTDRGVGTPAASAPEHSSGAGTHGETRPDEGVRPVRYPDLDVDATPQPGQRLSVIVDALLEPSGHTDSPALALPALDDTWEHLELRVLVTCPLIDFGEGADAGGAAVLTVFRNAPSVAAEFEGRLTDAAQPGESFTIQAAFFDGQRFCGSAQREFVVGQAPKDRSLAHVPGRIDVDVLAEPPDATVYVSRDRHAAPNTLNWHVVTPRFDGLPARLHGTTNLGQDPASLAATLFAEFARLEAGRHERTIHAFGSRLWQQAPAFFRDVYWALDEHYQRPLSLQFITDDPHLPWEFMRPVSDDETVIHSPLAVRHRVGRWLRDWDGLMPASIEPGALYTIAPKYRTASAKLPRAQAESQQLVTHFEARQVPGTRHQVIDLLEDRLTNDPIAMLHFAGHGDFNEDAAMMSALKLEDGRLTASEVGVPDVTLGKRCRSLVFLNACEVGAAGDVLGSVGGWADVFLKRHFGGFIAPLWAVVDQDASVVASAVVEGVLVDGERISDVLRSVREQHGATAPTFYSYLYYGDVNARVRAS